MLVGEAFNRLDPLAQQVMQALAIYPVPVPPVAVDYLLQPYRPAVDAAPVLGRLVNMQFVRRDAGHYYLHQVDRDYALSRLPQGHAADRDADPPPFTQQALRHRGAGYFEQTRTPREDWKTLDDLAPQLAEFELRYQGEGYDAAAHVLFGIDYDYLTQWGHYELTAGLYERLQGHLDDPWTDASSKHNLAECYRSLGKFTQAIDVLEQALAIARKTANRQGEGSYLGSLGNSHYELGQIPRALDLYERALAIARETGNRRGEAEHSGNLGNCYHDLGQILQAIERYEQALEVRREVGDRAGETNDLANLGICHGDLGQTARAINLLNQALDIARSIGYRYAEAHCLASLGEAHRDLGLWHQGTQYCHQAIEVADAIGNVQTQSRARRSLAHVHLLAGDFPVALVAVIAARDHDYPPDRAGLSLLSAIAHLRQNRPAPAGEEFRAAMIQADEQLRQASGNYQALNTKALALCGLTLTADLSKAVEASTMFRAVRTITSADGIVNQTLALFNTLAAADRGGILAEIRPAITGRSTE